MNTPPANAFVDEQLKKLLPRPANITEEQFSALLRALDAATKNSIFLKLTADDAEAMLEQVHALPQVKATSILAEAFSQIDAEKAASKHSSS